MEWGVGRKGDGKVCGVCGDKAFGFNFNAITCESCKAFFRRNAIKRKEFQCPFSGSCKIDVVTRRFCQKCRLRKCFDIGMKKDLILTEEQKKLKKRKIEENKVKRVYVKDDVTTTSLSPPEPDSSFSDSNSPGLCPMRPPSLQESPSRMTFDSRSYLGSDGILGSPAEASSQLHEDVKYPLPMYSSEALQRREPFNHLFQDELSPVPPSCSTLSFPNHTNVLSHLGARQTELKLENGFGSGSVGSPLRYNEKRELAIQTDLTFNDILVKNRDTKDMCVQADIIDNRISVMDLPDMGMLGTVMDGAIQAELGGEEVKEEPVLPLSREELDKISELKAANYVMNVPLEQEAPNFTGQSRKNPSLINVVNLTDLAIRRLIKMVKQIPAFRSLCQEDQVALLKGGCTEMLILRSVLLYDDTQDSWKLPQNSYDLKVGILKEARGNIYEEHQRFIRSFPLMWRTDEKLMLLLETITLFTPSRPCVLNPSIIRLEQEVYCMLLRRYLENWLGRKEGRDAYIGLLQILDALHSLNNYFVRIYLDVDPMEVQPLLIEIFDLKR